MIFNYQQSNDEGGERFFISYKSKQKHRCQPGGDGKGPSAIGKEKQDRSQYQPQGREIFIFGFFLVHRSLLRY